MVSFKEQSVDKGTSETTHGFAIRPNLAHEPTKKAFEDAHQKATDYLRKQLLDGH